MVLHRRAQSGVACFFFFLRLSESMARKLVSPPTPPETQPCGPGLIPVHHITVLINVTDYTLGKNEP